MTYLLKKNTKVAISIMLLRKSGYPYPERNCSQRIHKPVKDDKSIIKPNSRKAIQDGRNTVNDKIKDTKK